MGGRQGEGGPGDILSFFFYTHTMTPTFVFHHEILVLGDKIQLRTPPNIYPKPPNPLLNLTLTSFFKVISPIKVIKHAILKNIN